MFFEIDDIRRRHSMYFDTYNIHGWVDPPEGTLKWDFFRSAMAGSIALSL